MTSIIGAGLSGLIAATQFPQAQVFEANGADAVSHKALLRFRSDKLSRLLGIPFRKVMVRKSIYADRKHCAPNIELANQYSRKTNGGFLDRSIWAIDPVKRYIAPDDLQLQLIDLVGSRLNWNVPIQPDELGREPMISTMPMSVMLKMLRAKESAPVIAPGLLDDMFSFSSIKVDRFHIADADIYQTIYFPQHNTSVYRASMTGSTLIVERMSAFDDSRALTEGDPFGMVMRAFGLDGCIVESFELGHAQRFGKISPINDGLRRQFIYESTVHHHVYALGRFATWRNILLDDVVDDIAIVKRLISQGHYSAVLQHHKENVL